MSVNKQVRSACKQTTGPQCVHKSCNTKFILQILISRKRWLRRLTISNYYVTVFRLFFFFQAQNIPLSLEKLAHLCHECNVLTDTRNLSALALPTCMHCVPMFWFLFLQSGLIVFIATMASLSYNKHKLSVKFNFSSIHLGRILVN